MTNTDESCFHCGEPLPRGLEITIEVDGHKRPVCCSGCQAVVEIIIHGGFGNYYKHRTDRGLKVAEDWQAQQQRWLAFDQRQSYWGEALGNGHYRLPLVVEGIHCAACVWLIREACLRLDGIEQLDIDQASCYARLEWVPAKISFSGVLKAIQRLGYQPHLLGDDRLEEQRRRQQHNMSIRLLVAGLGMMQVMMYAVGLYGGQFQGIEPGLRHFLEGISLLVATPVVLYSAQPFFVGAWRSLWGGKPGMDVPVALALGLAFTASTVNYLRGTGTLYFDSVVMFTFFLLVARYLDLRLRHRALDIGHAFLRLLPETALLDKPAGVIPVPVADLKEGDRVLVPAGESIPADGLVTRGRTRVDESLLSGESQPLNRSTGQQILAGSINLQQPVTMQVTAAGNATALSALSRTLLDAQLSKPKSQLLADRIAAWFISGILLISVLVGVVWWQIDPSRMLGVVLAVLVISCPCALSLATPAVLAAASRRMLANGVLTARSDVLAVLAAADTVIFDKTGTLTLGRPSIEQLHLTTAGTALGEQQVLAMAAALEHASEHPLAQAFQIHQSAEIVATDFSIVPGQGVSGQIGDTRYRLGSRQLIGPKLGAATSQRVILADEKQLLAEFEITDPLRADAEQTVYELQQAGLEPRLLSGDREEEAQRVGRLLGIQHIKGRCSATEKLAEIQRLQKLGSKVLAVGDGINDGPVLAGADVSMAVNGASHVARSSADFIISGQHLAPVSRAIQVARQGQRAIRQNLSWALLYNLVAIPFAALGWVAPWMAAIGMSASSLLVVLNAVRFGRSGTVGNNRSTIAANTLETGDQHIPRGAQA